VGASVDQTVRGRAHIRVRRVRTRIKRANHKEARELEKESERTRMKAGGAEQKPVCPVRGTHM
jgi:hypothetical protein